MGRFILWKSADIPRAGWPAHFTSPASCLLTRQLELCSPAALLPVVSHFCALILPLGLELFFPLAVFYSFFSSCISTQLRKDAFPSVLPSCWLMYPFSVLPQHADLSLSVSAGTYKMRICYLPHSVKSWDAWPHLILSLHEMVIIVKKTKFGVPG